MRILNFKLSYIFFIWSLFILTNAVAEESVNVIEMPDGVTISFPMSEEDIIIADAEAERKKAMNSARRVEPKKWVNRYEMGDGHFVEFPMIDEEIHATIQKEKQEQKFLFQEYSNFINDQDEEGEFIEMGDGHVIIFYKNKPNKWCNFPC